MIGHHVCLDAITSGREVGATVLTIVLHLALIVVIKYQPMHTFSQVLSLLEQQLKTV